MQFLQLDLHIMSHLQVQCTQRLVQQQHFRLVYYRAGNGHTLLLTAAQGVHFSLLVARHVRHLQRTTHFLLDRFRIYLLQLQSEGYVVKYIQMREERIFLKHSVYRPFVRRSLGYVFAFQQNLTATRYLETCNTTQ